MLLALLAAWLVTGAWLCLENTAGITARLAHTLAGAVIMVLMCWTRWDYGRVCGLASFLALCDYFRPSCLLISSISTSTAPFSSMLP